MAALDYVTSPQGNKVSADEILTDVIEKRTLARNDRKRFEPIWRLCQAFLAGEQWTGITRTGRVLEERNPRKRERHTVNVLTGRFWRAIGKLYDPNFMPMQVFARVDELAQAYVRQGERAFTYAWEEEVHAQERILDLLVELCGYGTAGCRVRLDQTAGGYLGEVPIDAQGQQIFPDEQDPRYVQAMQAMQFGEPVPMRSVFEGRLDWEILSPFHMLPPPGIAHARLFPHITIDRPALLDDVKGMFPDAEKMTEQDLGQENLIGDRGSDTTERYGGSGRLRGHVLLSTMYERPCPKYPHGRTVVWSQETLLDVRDGLPFNLNGQPKAGIVFFHYHRLLRRFWGQGIVEPGIGPQRQRNRARSQMIEMKDKNLGRVYARKGAINETNRPVGKIMELIEVKQSSDMPIETAGIAPGPWIENEARLNDDDMDKAMGLGDTPFSSAPRGATAYSTFAMAAEEEAKTLGPIMEQFRLGIVEAAAYTYQGMRQWWPTDKQVLISGPDKQVEAFVFNATKLPQEVFFHFDKGAPAPRSAAAEIQKVFDIFDRSIASGRPLPVEWLVKSLDAGKALPLPEDAQQLQTEIAEQENLLMALGQEPPVQPFHDHLIHEQVHGQALQMALLSGNQPLAALITQHMQAHEQARQQQQQTATTVPSMQGGHGNEGSPHAPPQGAAPAPGQGQLVEGGR